MYKMASASIANRLKTILDFLIDKSQTGLVILHIWFMTLCILPKKLRKKVS